jgi:glycosyltransferase involved in cell wall biosynthesis
MLSVVIPTRNCERTLVPTLAMLVPGVMASVVREVLVADGGSTDGTREVVDFAGCTLLRSEAPLGDRLREAAAAARGDWLMFLRPGTVLDAGWIGETLRFLENGSGEDIDGQAAVFRRAPKTLRPRLMLVEVIEILRNTLAAPTADQGFVVSKPLYQRLGGHRDEADPENGLIRRVGRRRIARLRSGISPARVGSAEILD